MLQINYPLEVVTNTRQTTAKGLGVFETVSSLWAEGGAGRFYAGASGYLGQAWRPAIQQAIFEQAKKWYQIRTGVVGPHSDDDNWPERPPELEFIEAFLLGALGRREPSIRDRCITRLSLPPVRPPSLPQCAFVTHASALFLSLPPCAVHRLCLFFYNARSCASACSVCASACLHLSLYLYAYQSMYLCVCVSRRLFCGEGPFSPLSQWLASQRASRVGHWLVC